MLTAGKSTEVGSSADLKPGMVGGGGGVVLPYITTGMCLPIGYTLCPFWSGMGYGFQGNYVFIVSIPNE